MFSITSAADRCTHRKVTGIELKWFVVALFSTPKIDVRFEVLAVVLLKI
jgi:hypothetical protein